MARNERLWSAERVSQLVDKTTGALNVKTGDPVRIGIVNAVAITDAGRAIDTGSNVGFLPSLVGSENHIPTGNEPGYASIKTTGSWVFPVTAASGVTEGQAIYAIANGDAEIKKVTLTTASSGNKLWGWAREAAASGTPVVEVAVISVAV